jgi:L-lactate dehydrogenase complex protein LldG
VEVALMQREYVLHKVRTALGRSAGQEPGEAPPVRIRIPRVEMADRVDRFCGALEALAGKTYRAQSMADARAYVQSKIEGKTAVASNAPYLGECGITDLAGVRTGITNPAELKDLCATSDFGITSADYALADTGSLVMIASPHEARLVSLLPPAHIAVVPRERLLTGLDELFTIVPKPADITSSMVLITGPSRTADIEQFLVRGVHGPGTIHVVLVG